MKKKFLFVILLSIITLLHSQDNEQLKLPGLISSVEVLGTMDKLLLQQVAQIISKLEQASGY